MFPQQQPSTHWTFDPVHRENKNEFNKFEIASLMTVSEPNNAEASNMIR